MYDEVKKQAKVIVEPDGVSIATFAEEYEEINYPKAFKVDNPETVEKSTIDAVIDDNFEYNQEKLEDALATTEIDLGELLDSYDPTFPNYVPSEQAFEFFNIMRLVEGEDFEFDTPIAHYFMVDALLGNITDTSPFPYSKKVCNTLEVNYLRLAFMCSRGMAKSSVVISFFGVYSAIKGTLPNGIGKVWFYLVLAASSRGGARVNALAVRAMCEESEFLLGYFEEMRFTETESEFVRRGPGPRKNRSFLIRYQGVGTGVRGIRYGQRRICHIILDDIILNEAAAYSKTITENLESVIHSDSVAALKGGGKGRITNCFTPFSYSDVNTRLVLSGAYTPCVIPISSAFDPESNNLRINNITSSWEAYHPRRSILDLVRDAKKTKTLSKFMQERMLRLSSGADRLVPDKCIQFTDTDVIIKHIYAYNVYITSDFTTTSGESSDFSGIAAWAVSNNSDWFMLELALRKMDMTEQYTVMLDWAAKYARMGKYVELGVEVDGNQAAHIFGLEEIMAKRGQWFSFAKQKNADKDSTRKGILNRNGGGSKIERFRIAVNNYMLPMKMWFPKKLRDTPDMIEMIKQLKGATHETFTRADDGCFTGDTLVYLSNNTTKRIDVIQKGDMVMTSSVDSAYSQCGAAIMTGVKEVMTYTFSDGSQLSMTDNHPVYTTEGWVYAEDLLPTHKIIKAVKWEDKLQYMESNGLGKSLGTTNQPQKLRVNEDGCISGCGTKQMESSQQDMKCITSTTTKIIMTSVTWNCLVQKSMLNTTKVNAGYYDQKKIEKRIAYNWIVLEYLLISGIVQIKDENGIDNTEKALKMLYSLKTKYVTVIHAELKLCHISKQRMCTAPKNAHLRLVLKEIKKSTDIIVKYADVNLDHTGVKVHPKHVVLSVLNNYNSVMHKSLETSSAEDVVVHSKVMQARDTVKHVSKKNTEHLKMYPALSAEEYLSKITKQLNTAQYNVEKIQLIGKSERRDEKTYNLEIKDTATYLVGSGIIVHNCDLISMISQMRIVLPTESSYTGKVHSATLGGGIYSNIEYEADDEENYGCSTVF